ncbi:PEBP-like protein [Trichodelitschia bisporula]|uniref:PEBP-like protein n=1 Tax=Trichodelitschia bisporula TaxID=703511 RepID=A0A6G1HI72_9PEZI|nr:PEBP-like protein [Trichodelitschia bisporula]
MLPGAILALAALALAQTPGDFQPSSLVKLDISFGNIAIDPAGTQLQSLDQAAAAPGISLPESNLLGPDGKPVPSRRYMIFMIDTDVVSNNVATTFLHWFQPDLLAAPEAPASAPLAAGAQANGLANSSSAQFMSQFGLSKAILAAAGSTGSAATAAPKTSYLPPSPPPGPPHRYVLTVFAQPANFSVPACYQNVLTDGRVAGGAIGAAPGGATPAAARVGFDLNQFLRAARVNPRPVAGTYFRAQNPQPGSLAVSAMATALVDAKCAGVTVAGMGPPPGGMAGGMPKMRRVGVPKRRVG